MYLWRDLTRLLLSLGNFVTLSTNPFINAINVHGVTLSVTQMVMLSLNEFIFLLGGYSLNRQKNLPCKICRGAFRPSAFLIKLAWEAPALGQVAGAQFMQCDVNGLCEATGGGAELLGMDPGRKWHLAGPVWVQDPGQGASVPAAAQGSRLFRHSCPASFTQHTSQAGWAGSSWCQRQACNVRVSCEGQYGNYPV